MVTDIAVICPRHCQRWLDNVGGPCVDDAAYDGHDEGRACPRARRRDSRSHFGGRDRADKRTVFIGTSSEVAERVVAELGRHGEKIVAWLRTANALIAQAVDDDSRTSLADSAGYNLREALDAVVKGRPPAGNAATGDDRDLVESIMSEDPDLEMLDPCAKALAARRKRQRIFKPFCRGTGSGRGAGPWSARACAGPVAGGDRRGHDPPWFAATANSCAARNRTCSRRPRAASSRPPPSPKRIPQAHRTGPNTVITQKLQIGHITDPHIEKS